MKPVIEISTESDLWESMENIEVMVEKLVACAIHETGTKLRPASELSLLLCDDAAIRVLNRDWRKIDKATNVLSFPAPGILAQRPVVGDIAISFETMRGEALAESKTLHDHFAHLFLHGFLHLVGFDHETETDAEVMEEAERKILARLGIADPYAGTVSLENRTAP